MNTNLFDNAFPFTGLFQRQAGILEEAFTQLADILRAFAAVPDKCVRIGALLAEGDTICRKIERELALTFIHPLNREDIRELNRAFERTLRAVGAVSSRLGLYGFSDLQKGAGSHAACLAEMAAEVAPLLKVIVRKGNGAASSDRVRKLKKEADLFLLVGLGELYESAGGGVDTLLAAMKWSQIYDRLEETALCLEHTVNVVEGIIQKKV
jgi:uncharacterized protein Yka (UPF0111/DUF47 family)